MKAGYDTAVGTHHALTSMLKYRAPIRRILYLLLFMALGPVRASADGCFVFKWNKAIDINEPAQKAIVCFEPGREQLLLQVKYEGPLEEFGWLIPTPSLPKVEKGSMAPFYELSQLTQRRFGPPETQATRGGVATLGADGEEKRVKVIEIKTVGAYEVSVLSAQDSGSLRAWLEAHDYSFPDDKSEILEEYTRRGWYFIAAKIELNKGLGFKSVPAASPRPSPNVAKARKAVQAKLSSGELHPILISFETPKPVFPLKISAVGGKPSEVSLYIIAPEPFLEPFIFGKSIEKLGPQYARWKEETPQRARQREQMRDNSRTIGLRFYLDSFYTTNRGDRLPEHLRDYTPEDLTALAREGQRPLPPEPLSEIFHADEGAVLQCLRLSAGQTPDSAKAFAVLAAGDWYVTKHVHTFTPAEMHDLEFEPVFPALARLIAQPPGAVAARILGQLGPNAQPWLSRACQSTNPIERLNAVVGIELNRLAGFGESLSSLLGDETPAVRLHALRAIGASPEKRLVDKVVGMLRDHSLEVRQEATGYLMHHERPDRTPFYLGLMRDPDPNVRVHSLAIASWINRYATSDEVFQAALRLLKDPNEDVRASALHALYRMRDKAVPRADLLPFLSSSEEMMSVLALNMLRPGPPGAGPPEERDTLSSLEAAALITNRLTMARLAGLKILQHNADAAAVELILPLLTDTNKIVRNRAFVVLRRIAGENVSESDPAKWQAWWAANKASFR